MRQNPRRWGLRLLVISVGLIAFVVGLDGPLPAHAQDAFVVRNVMVDETADSADAARNTALANGQQMAWRFLMQRLVPIGDQQRAISAGQGQLTDLVRSFGVDEERVSSERYIANLTYRFNADAVRSLLSVQNIPFAESPGPTLLVLPVLVRGGAALLWSEGDAVWLQAWQNAPPGHGLIALRAPFGDLSDLLSLDAEDAVQGNWALMEPLAERYGAQGVLVATIEAGSSNSLSLTSYTEAIGEQVAILGSRIVPSLSAGDLLNAVMTADESVNETWKMANLLTPDSQDEIVVDVSFDDLANWLEMRRVLSGTAIVQDVETLVLSAKSARVNLRYLGDVQRLQSTLRQQGLALVERGDVWLIYPL